MRPIVIAELANSHQGKPEAALELAISVLKLGAQAVKFQFYTAPELLVRNHPRYDHFSQQSFSPTQWEHIITSILPYDKPIYADVFGLESLSLAHELGIRHFKVHASDLTNTSLLSSLCNLDPHAVLLSVGGATAPEISEALHFLSSLPNVTLMHGFQAYPTPHDHTNLARLTWLQQTFGRSFTYGYQDHVDADTPLSTHLPLMAIALGATILEKHVTINRSAKGVDYYSSFEPFEFQSFLSHVTQATEALGMSSHSFSISEVDYRNITRKRIVSNSSLAAGHILERKDLSYKRVPASSNPSCNESTILGRPLLAPILQDQQITQALVPTKCWALVLARTASSRLPSKALLDIQGRPSILHLLDRLKQSSCLNNIVLCTTHSAEDDVLETLAHQAGVACFRGSTDDVLQRMLGAISNNDVDVVVRVTGDDILVDPEYLDQGFLHHIATNSDYTDLKALPSGTEAEFFNVSLLKLIHRLAVDASGTEYLTAYVSDNSHHFNVSSAPVSPNHSYSWRLTLDTPEDYEVIVSILDSMSRIGKPLTYRLSDIVDFLNTFPEKLELNAHVRQRQTPPTVNTKLEWSRLNPMIEI